MILVDTAPLVALFDPKDAEHSGCRVLLSTITEPLVVTTPVLTEAFQLLHPGSPGARALRTFLRRRGASTWFLGDASILRALDLMDRYADHPMDFADASIVAAAEALRTTKIFTLDRADFASYRVRLGRTHRGFRMITPEH